MEKRVCTKCTIHHYENCHTCFGFGIYKKHPYLRPISADIAHDTSLTKFIKWDKCPECGSGINGCS